MAKSARTIRKIFVVDTCVLLHDPNAIFHFGQEGNTVVLAIDVVDEIDKKKNYPGIVGFNARTVARIIDALRTASKSNLEKGVEIPSGGKLQVLCKIEIPPKRPDTVDYRVVGLALHLHKTRKTNTAVILVSKDCNVRIKADALGVEAQDYEHDKLIKDIDEMYSGRTTIQLSAERANLINELHTSGTLGIQLFGSDVNPQELYPNQCCFIRFEDKYCLAIYDSTSQSFQLVKKTQRNGKIHPRNDEQALALALLMNPKIDLVTLAGKAGTGKTLMALLAAHLQSDPIKGPYKKILVRRPTKEMGESLGYLPGDLADKMGPWEVPIRDSLHLIMDHTDSPYGRNTGDPLTHMIETGFLSIGPINFDQGRTAEKVFYLVDEAQNLSPAEIKALITRAGEGTKVVLTGDPAQITSSKLDAISNGVTHTVMKGMTSPRIAHITLEKGERSWLAGWAADEL